MSGTAMKNKYIISENYCRITCMEIVCVKNFYSPVDCNYKQAENDFNGTKLIIRITIKWNESVRRKKHSKAATRRDYFYELTDHSRSWHFYNYLAFLNLEACLKPTHKSSYRINSCESKINSPIMMFHIFFY